MTATELKCSKSSCKRPAKRDHRGMCWKHWEHDQRQRVASGDWVAGWEPAEKVVAHLDALLESGLSYRRIAEASGLTIQGLYMFRSRKRVRLGNAQALYAVPVNGFRESERSGYVPIIGLSRRVQALIAIGYTQVDLASRIGIAVDGLSEIVHQKRPWVQVSTAKRISAVFDELQMTDAGNSKGNSRARNLARRNGWAPPLAWDEDTIDNPAAEPQAPKGDDKQEFLDTYAELKALGLDDNQIAERIGMVRESMKARLRRLTAA